MLNYNFLANYQYFISHLSKIILGELKKGPNLVAFVRLPDICFDLFFELFLMV